MSETSFDLWGDAGAPAGPVVLSVPHAGRDYPAGLHDALRVPLAAARVLEDRFVDRIALAARTAETTLIQRTARAWIDLNRDETERDPRIDEGACGKDMATISAKLRSGLGLVPRRAGKAGDLWRRRFTDAEVIARIAAVHRPYHAALAAALAAARARFGVAVLLDLHSMPSLGRDEARIVIGDRCGRSAATRFVERINAEARATGCRTARNIPYAGGHILAAHGRPADGIHAVQLEIDRTLYLDHRLDQPGEGLPRMAAMVANMLTALADEALGSRLAIAAE